MKMKYFSLLIIFTYCTVFGAKFTLYNECVSTVPLQVWAIDESGKKYLAQSLSRGAKISFNTNKWSSFKTLLWRQYDNIGEKIFSLDVRSPGNMIMGSINLYDNGEFAKNFTPVKVGGGAMNSGIANEQK